MYFNILMKDWIIYKAMYVQVNIDILISKKWKEKDSIHVKMVNYHFIKWSFSINWKQISYDHNSLEVSDINQSGKPQTFTMQHTMETFCGDFVFKFKVLH